MSPDEIEWIMCQSTWSLEVEGQHSDAQTMEWCRQMLAGEISLEEYLDLVIRRATEQSVRFAASSEGAFFVIVIFDYCGAVFALGFLV